MHWLICFLGGLREMSIWKAILSGAMEHKLSIVAWTIWITVIALSVIFTATCVYTIFTLNNQADRPVHSLIGVNTVCHSITSFDILH